MAVELFGPLSSGEECVLFAAFKGEVADCGGTGEYWADENDPHGVRHWNKSRNVRAALLNWLYLDPQAVQQVHLAGVTVWGARTVAVSAPQEACITSARRSIGEPDSPGASR